MDAEKFKNKISQLGSMVRVHNGLWDKDGYKDTVLAPNPVTEVCGDCNKVVQDRVVTFEVKWGYKDQPYWLKKCLVCKEKIAIKNSNNK
jgi:hypothetical protein